MIEMEKPKKTIKNLRDIEKLMSLMQQNRISRIVVDGVEVQVNSFKSDMIQSNPRSTGGDIDETTMYWSSQ